MSRDPANNPDRGSEGSGFRVQGSAANPNLNPEPRTLNPTAFPVRPLELDFLARQPKPSEEPAPPGELSPSDIRFCRIVSKIVAPLVLVLALASVAAAFWFVRYLIHTAYHNP